MVSHHHGIIDYAVPPLMILPEIVRVVQKQIPVFVDCGIESDRCIQGIGTRSGRRLRGQGAHGVSAGKRCGRRTGKIASLTEELAGIMARTGASDLSQIDPSVIWKA